MMKMALQTSRVGSLLDGLEAGDGAGELTGRVTGAVISIVLIVDPFYIHNFGGGGIWSFSVLLVLFFLESLYSYLLLLTD